MKSPWSVVFVVAAIAFLCITQANSDEPGDKPPAPAADPMRGKVPGDVRDDNGLKMKFVWCPPGFLTMEQVEVVREPAAEKDEQTDDDVVDPKDEPAPEPRLTTKITPVRVFLSKGYWLGKYEVTQSEWKEVMKTEPWKGEVSTKEGADFPATNFSWDDAVDFWRKLTEQERQAGRLPKDWEYTLPTEAEWEYACRARTQTKFSFGDDESKLGDYAWFRDNSWNAGELYAHRVGQKKANPWGLFDMHGNVSEWCRDVYADKLPGGRDPKVKPDEKTSGSRREFRGGGWSDDAAVCRSAYRPRPVPSPRGTTLGFRLALSCVQ